VALARQVLAEGHVTPFRKSKITEGRCLGIRLPIACPRGIRHALLPAASNLGLFFVDVSWPSAPSLTLKLRPGASDCICDELLSSFACTHPEVSVVHAATDQSGALRHPRSWLAHPENPKRHSPLQFCCVQILPELHWRGLSLPPATMARSCYGYGCSLRNSNRFRHRRTFCPRHPCVSYPVSPHSGSWIMASLYRSYGTGQSSYTTHQLSLCLLFPVIQSTCVSAPANVVIVATREKKLTERTRTFVGVSEHPLQPGCGTKGVPQRHFVPQPSHPGRAYAFGSRVRTTNILPRYSA